MSPLVSIEVFLTTIIIRLIIESFDHLHDLCSECSHFSVSKKRGDSYIDLFWAKFHIFLFVLI